MRREFAPWEILETTSAVSRVTAFKLMSVEVSSNEVFIAEHAWSKDGKEVWMTVVAH